MTKTRPRLASLAALAMLGSCAPSPPPSAPIADIAIEAPSGTYRLDHSHASITVSVLHQRFSHFTFRFDRLDVEVDFDAAQPTRSTATATVDLASVNTGLADFDPEVAAFLGAGTSASARFRSVAIERVAPNTASVVGELTLNGVTRPVTLSATLNRADRDMFGRRRIGVSARGVLSRTAFGIAPELPPDDVDDSVDVAVELELTLAAQ